MKITYIGHACLMIDTGDVKIVTDPWFAGPAYCGQWNIFPKPINVELLNSADVIAISHGHEDHMHEQSLQKLSKEKPIFFPRLGYGSATGFLGSMGFTKVIEANTYRKYKLSKETSITYITNELDSIIIIEKGGKNFINLNDALHADPEHSIAAFTDILRKRYANIDVVFCGFGGASYYPNTFSVPGKSDLEIGQLREQVYVHNFCKIIHRLRPRIAVPFAADFVLLSPDQRWVNSIRFTRSKIKEYYEKYFQIDEKYSVAIYDMYSGDVLSDGKIFQYSPYRERMKDGGLNHLIDEQYTEEISSLKIEKCLDKQDEEMLGDSITNQLNHRSTVIKHAKLNKIKFCINVLDVSEDNYYNVRFNAGRAAVRRAGSPDQDCLLTIQTTSRVLYYSFGNEWGGDAICIGYGCKIQVHDKSIIKSGLHRVCINLLTRYPTFASYSRSAPFKAVRLLMSNPGLRMRYLNRLLKRTTRDIVSGEHWLLHSRDQICQDFHMPVLAEASPRDR